MYMYMYVYIYVCIYVRIYVCMYVFICICIYKYMYMYIGRRYPRPAHRPAHAGRSYQGSINALFRLWKADLLSTKLPALLVQMYLLY